jgi:hypothetical protein
VTNCTILQSLYRYLLATRVLACVRYNARKGRFFAFFRVFSLFFAFFRVFVTKFRLFLPFHPILAYIMQNVEYIMHETFLSLSDKRANCAITIASIVYPGNYNKTHTEQNIRFINPTEQNIRFML